MPTIGLSAPFVGRAEAIDSLRKWLSSAARGFALVSGEAGIGKSRLVDEFAAEAAARGLKVLKGRCYDGLPPAPFLPILELFAASEGTNDTDAVARDLARMLRLPHTSEISAGAGDARLRFFSRLSKRLLDTAAESRLLLVIDDLQWIDPDSLLFLGYLLDVSDISLLATRRDPCPARGVAALAGFERRAQRMELGPLSKEDAMRLAATALPSLQEADEEYVFELSGGNPLFLLELLRELPLDGLAIPHIRPGLGAPRSLAAYLDQRLEGLGQKELEVLGAASVIGRRFDPFLLAQALGVAQRDVEATIDEAASFGIVRNSSCEIDGSFEFAHPVFRERLYQRLDAKQRRALHGRLGRLPAPHLQRLTLEQIAIHRALGFEEQERDEAIASCQSAAESAERMLAYQSGVELWRLALSCETEAVSARRAFLLHRMGLAHRAYGNWEEAIPALRRAFEIYEILDDHAPAGAVALYLGELYRFRLELDESYFWLSRAVKKDLSPAQRQKALALLSTTHAARDEYALAARVLDEAMALGPIETPDVAFWASFTLMVLGKLDQSSRVSLKGLEASMVAGDDAYTALHAGSLAQMELSRLDPEACERYVRIVEESSSLVDTVSLVRALLCRSLLEGLRGNWREVLDICERWQCQVKRAGSFQVAVARMVMAEALSALCRHEEAIFHAAEAIPLLGNNKQLGTLHLARIQFRAGDTEAARSIVAQAAPQTLFRERGGASRALLADLVDLIEDEGLVRRLYKAFQAERRKISAVYAPVSVFRVRAKLAARLRLWKEAFADFEAAAADLSAAGAMAELAATYHDHAVARRRRGRKGDPLKAASLDAAARHASGRDEAIWPDADGAAPNRFGLTMRELDVLRLIAQGRRNSEIAEALYVSTHTVDRHIENMFVKLGVHTRTGAVLRAATEGIVFDTPRG